MKKFLKARLSQYPKLHYAVMIVYKHTFWKIKGIRANKRFLSHGEEVLAKVGDVFSELGITWWLEYGTLLGAVREHDFITHDVDIDIGLWHQDYDQNIEEIFLKYGFCKKRAFLIDNGKYGREETFSYKGVDVDLFYFKQKEKRLIGYGFRPAEGMTAEQTIQEKGGLLVREITFPYDGLKPVLFKDKMF